MDKNQIYRQKILSCTKEILINYGEDAITIDNIARKCKISKSTFYNYFSNKEDLLNHLSNLSDIDGFFVSGTRDLILLKATEAFSKFGFNEIDMDKIAELANIKRTTIYHYFSNKEELWENCIQYIIDNQKNFIKSIMEISEDPIEILENYLEYLCKTKNEYCSVIVIVVKHHYLRNEKIQKLFREFINMKIQFFSSIIEDGKQKGYYRKEIDTVATAKFMVTFLFGIEFMNLKDIGKSEREFFEILHNTIKESNPF